MAAIAEISCANTVAVATPATPMLNTITNKRSSPTLIRLAIIKITSGMVELPIERSTEDIPLYMQFASVPINIMTR